jgi:hypothetical protein
VVKNKDMPLHPNKKILFIHIPKCYGSSIEICFGMQREDLFFKTSNIYNFDGISFAPQHLRFIDLMKFDEIKKIKNDLFIFSFVRNPYDRFVSEYFWFNKGVNFNKHHFKNWYKRHYSKIDLDHKLRQTDFLINENNEIDIDFIGKVENIQEDWKKLLKLIGFNENIKLPHKNKSNNRERKDFMYYLDNEDITFINEMFYDDFINFDYKML